MEALKRNNQAIAAMNAGDYIRANMLFRENAKKSPCHLSFNNLGCYYWEYGCYSSKGFVRNAKVLGMNYLQKARELFIHPVNLCKIGACLFEQGRKSEAAHYYKEAALYGDIKAVYNLASCYISMNAYQEASDLLESLAGNPYTVSCLTEEDADPFLPSLIISLLCHKPIAYLKEPDLRILLNEKDDEAVICCLYLLKRYSEVVAKSERYLQDWVPNRAIMAMILESYRETGLSISNSFQNSLEEYKKKIGLNSDSSKEQIQAAIQEYHYNLPLIESCGFYGCPIHHTSVPAETLKQEPNNRIF